MSTYNTGFNAEINEQVKMLRDFGTIHRDCEEIKVKAILHEAMRERKPPMTPTNDFISGVRPVNNHTPPLNRPTPRKRIKPEGKIIRKKEKQK